MGASKKKRLLFLQQHRCCYFCGGTATTLDHVPSRQCFRNRIGPEGYEFPACQMCNSSAGPIEQAVALYLRLADHDDTALNEGHLKKLFQGVANNTPHYLPTDDATTNEKRRAVKGSRLLLRQHETFSNAPVLRLPDENRQAFQLFERRLVCALYYKHFAGVLPPTHLIRTHRTQFITRDAETLVKKIAPMLPQTVTAQRQNTDIGDQFMYVWYGSQDHQIFAFLAQFSKSFMFIGVACPPDQHDGSPDYIPHSSDL